MYEAIEIQLRELNNHLIKIIENPAYAVDQDYTKTANEIFEKSMYLFQMTERVMLQNRTVLAPENDDDILIQAPAQDDEVSWHPPMTMK